MKGGIDYFPLDVALDEKWELIESEFGLTGFGVVVKLLQRIYGGQGYYVEWTNEVALLFAKKIGLGGNAVSEIVSASVKRGIFDKTLYEKYGILTSAGIQDRYFEAVSRRKNVKVDPRYLLVPYAQKKGNVCNSDENADIFCENVYISEQSKVEESRGKKTKERENARGSSHSAHKRSFGTYGNVLLTDEEYSALCRDFPDAGRKIDRLSAYMRQSGKVYADHAAVIREWAREDAGKKPDAFPRTVEETDAFWNAAVRASYGESFGKVIGEEERSKK